MATVLEIMELYRTMMALLKPLEGVFGGAWQSVWAGGMGLPERMENALNSSGDPGKIGRVAVSAMPADFFGEFTDSVNSGNTAAAAPRRTAGFNGFDRLGGSGGLSGLSVFDLASRLPERPVRPERPARPGNGGFFYTDFGDKGAFGYTGHTGYVDRNNRNGRSGRTGERGLNIVSEKIRGGNDGSRLAGGAFVFPDYGAGLGMVLDKQSTSKRIFGIGVGRENFGYFNFSGEYGNSGSSGENRGLLYTLPTLRSDRMFPAFPALENPENVLVPNARTEVSDLWRNTEHLRIAELLKIGDDIASGERLAAVRGYAERETGGFGGFGGSEINIDMSSMKNIVNSKSDMDELIDRLCGAISEAAFSMAEGVHS